MPEPQPSDAPCESRSDPSSIEGGAIATGCAVGCLMTILQRVSVLLLMSALSWLHLPMDRMFGFSPAWMVMGIFFEFAAVAVVGFFTACRARHAKIKHAGIVGVLLCLTALFPWAFMLGNGPPSLPAWIYWLMLLKALLPIPAALFGAYIANSVERNRHVRID